jgi:hypothetical protein
MITYLPLFFQFLPYSTLNFLMSPLLGQDSSLLDTTEKQQIASSMLQHKDVSIHLVTQDLISATSMHNYSCMFLA